MKVINDESRFSIWDLNRLYSNFNNDIENLNIALRLKKQIIELEYNKLKMCRYTLDKNYNIKNVISSDNKLYVHHYWNHYLFDIDIIDIVTGEIINFTELALTLANIFNVVVNSVMNDHQKLEAVIGIIAATLNNARFDIEQFKFLVKNIKNTELADRIASRLVLNELSM